MSNNTNSNNKKIYLKTFLIDFSEASNGMKLSNTIINPHQRFIGKDVIYTPDKNHPPEFTKYKQTGDPVTDIQTFLELQAKYRIGRIIEVNKSLVQGSNELVYTATIEIDTEKGRNLYRHGLLPKFVSPSIYMTKGSGFSDIQDFEALHLALVKAPAYDYRKARVRGSCEDTPEICSNQLAQAHLVQASTPEQQQKKRKRSKEQELRRVMQFTGAMK